MSFNTKKCSVMHFGKRNLKYSYTLYGEELKKSHTEKDLGVLMSDSGKFNEHVSTTAAKANKMVGLVRRSFKTKSPEVMKTIYNAYVRPVIEYASPVWNPVYKNQIKTLESVQRRFWKRARNEVRVPESECSHELNMLKTDLILMHQLYVNPASSLSFSTFFNEARHDKITRQTDAHQISMPGTTSNVRKHSFATRQIKVWNSIPYLVRKTDKKNFKKWLDENLNIFPLM